MRYLIVNADDFGLHQDINRGIIKGFQEGFITSTSLMCSAPCFEQAVALAKENLQLGIGLHLTLVGGVKPLLPLTQVATLIDEQGVFPADYLLFIKKFISGKINKAEIRAELSAQIERGLAAGLNITHIDSHQHLHVLPGLIDIVIELCQKYQIPRLRMPAEALLWQGGYQAGAARYIGKWGLTVCAQLAARKAQQAGLRYPQHFFGMLAGGNLDEQLVKNMLQALPEGTSELMTHPGLQAKQLRSLFTWGYHWEEELQAFLSLSNQNEIKERAISLINFGGLDYAK